MRNLAVLATAAVLLAGAGGCGNEDSRALREPSPHQTTTTRPSLTTAPPAPEGADPALQLTTPAFMPGGTMPDRYTCRGEDISPGLDWANVPDGTVALAIVVRDQSTTVEGADGHSRAFVHWIVAGIHPSEKGLAEGTLPEEAVESLNDFGRPGWAGPCPPAGSGEHLYELRIYAVAESLDLQPDLTADQAVGLVERAAIRDSTAFTATVAG